MGRLKEYTFQGRNLVGDVFIETGTYEGETTQAALDAGYPRIHTIEVCERLFQHSQKRFENEPQVTVHHGSSPDVLPSVCDPSLKTTFWLDGHYQSGPRDEMDPTVGECPLLAELDVIVGVPWATKPVVIIDDARIFTSGEGRDAWMRDVRLDPAQWPTLIDIMLRLGQDYLVVEHNDMLFCLPDAAKQGASDGPELEEVAQVAVG